MLHSIKPQNIVTKKVELVDASFMANHVNSEIKEKQSLYCTKAQTIVEKRNRLKVLARTVTQI